MLLFKGKCGDLEHEKSWKINRGKHMGKVKLSRYKFRIVEEYIKKNMFYKELTEYLCVK